MTERLTEKVSEGIWVKEAYGENVLKTLYQCFGSEPSPNYSNCDEGYCGMEKLERYETAEEEGRLILLPCKIGTSVYEIYYILSYGEIGDPAEKQYLLRERSFDLSMLNEVGKTVFLIEEEAKKTLKEMEKIT